MAENLFLAIETSADSGGAALMDGGGAVLQCRMLGADTRHGQGLAPAIHACMDAEGGSPGYLSGIAVDCGPGSYTGLRVGVMTAKALAWGAGVPVCGVCSLDALAWEHRECATRLAVLTRARRNELYFALYRSAGNAPPVREEAVCALSPADAAARLEALSEETAVFGSGLAMVGELPGRKASLILAHDLSTVPSPGAVGRLGISLFAERPGGDPLHALQPSYPRRSGVTMPVLGEPVEGSA